eukprot:jgi/Psemu1/262545/estExt_Genewise1Plus.C_7950003
MQCSFSITGPKLDACEDSRQKFYDDFMEGCFEAFGGTSCLEQEMERHDMNIAQPQSMVNMTSTGYHKTKAPASLMKLLTKFWEDNRERKQSEEWGPGSIFVNHWEVPSYVVDLDNKKLKGGGEEIKKAIYDAAIDGVAEWTGGQAKLRPVSVYGIRQYLEGAILSPHVDRNPLVSSGIVNVAQDVEEPWPLEVYGRDGKAVNITMEPGDMVLYESHSLIHGRPFPLKGRYMANVFIHFEPIDVWGEGTEHGVEEGGILPPYVLPGSPGAESYLERFPNGWSKEFTQGKEPDVHEYAAQGELDKLKEASEISSRFLGWKDHNGWTPMHEAARNGHKEVMDFLIEKGEDVNTLSKDKMSPLRIAIEALGVDHELVTWLLSIGAQDIDESPADEEGEDFDEMEEFDGPGGPRGRRRRRGGEELNEDEF